MGRGQPLRDLPADAQHLGHVERAGAVESLLERLAGDELHRQVGERLFADLVDLHHVLVPHLGRRPGLAQEAFAGRGQGRNLRGHHLDRDHALQRLVEGAEDDAEAALAEHLEHFVMPQPAQRVGAGGRGEERQLVGVRVGRAVAGVGRIERHRPGLARVGRPGRGLRPGNCRPGHGHGGAPRPVRATRHPPRTRGPGTRPGPPRPAVRPLRGRSP